MQNIGTLGGTNSHGTAINSTGSIVGYSPTVSGGRQHAFLYSNGTFTDLGTNGGTASFAYGVNRSDEVVGMYYQGVAEIPRAFKYTNGSMVDIGTLGGTSSKANRINDQGSVVGWADTQSAGQHAFLYDGTGMKDLNTLIPQNSGWTLTSANDINSFGQIVGEGVINGQTRAFRLSPYTPPPPIQSVLPASHLPPLRSADNLVVVAHGWLGPGGSPETQRQWIQNMANSIANQVPSGSSGWDVIAYDWTDLSSPLNLETVLENGIKLGFVEGQILGGRNYENVHIIAHSAGAAFAESAAVTIHELSPSTNVHISFLDPYAPPGVRNWYGSAADWSDNYYTANDALAFFTDDPLPKVHNIDITKLDAGGAGHSFAHMFYQMTTSPSQAPDWGGYGFPLSIEASSDPSNWNVLANYLPGYVAELAPNQLPTLKSLASDTRVIMAVDLQDSLLASSSTGSVAFLDSGNQALMRPGSPVWFVTGIALNNPAELLQVHVDFETTAGSGGLLSVYIDETLIGILNEAPDGFGTQHFFPLPNTDFGFHQISFRFDPTDGSTSGLLISDVRLTMAVPEPTAFGLTIFAIIAVSLTNISLRRGRHVTRLRMVSHRPQKVGT